MPVDRILEEKKYIGKSVKRCLCGDFFPGWPSLLRQPPRWPRRFCTAILNVLSEAIES